MIQVECIGSTHGYLLSELWDESDDRITRQTESDRQQDVRWLQIRVWHDRSYIAPIPLLAHGLTVKLSPCLCGRVAACLCGYYKCNLLLAQARPRMIIFLVVSLHLPYFTPWLTPMFVNKEGREVCNRVLTLCISTY